MTIEILILMLMLGIGMKTSYLNPDFRFELLDLSERSYACQPQLIHTEPGHLYPGKGKATNYSADRLMICSKGIFSNQERHSYLNFITASAAPQARRIAHSLDGLVRQHIDSPSEIFRNRPLTIAVEEKDPVLQNYLHDVFTHEFAAVLGTNAVSRSHLVEIDERSKPLIKISLREVDAADLLFDVRAEFVSQNKELRWQL
jgi:hypothetical protein